MFNLSSLFLNLIFRLFKVGVQFLKSNWKSCSFLSCSFAVCINERNFVILFRHATAKKIAREFHQIKVGKVAYLLDLELRTSLASEMSMLISERFIGNTCIEEIQLVSNLSY